MLLKLAGPGKITDEDAERVTPDLRFIGFIGGGHDIDRNERPHTRCVFQSALPVPCFLDPIDLPGFGGLWQRGCNFRVDGFLGGCEPSRNLRIYVTELENVPKL